MLQMGIFKEVEKRIRVEDTLEAKAAQAACTLACMCLGTITQGKVATKAV
jgi:hypothetical protein